MDAYLNFHTHRTARSEKETVVMNHMPFQKEMVSESLFSIGVHPWFISADVERALNEVSRQAVEENCIGIGEIGLDKCAETEWETQKDVFGRQLLLADQLKMPVVLHCVRAWSELLHFLKTVNVIGVVHGFRGKPELARQLLDCGLYLSFGFRYNPDSMVLCPPDRIFFETDEDSRSVEFLYQEAAKLRGDEPEFLRSACWSNLKTIWTQRGNRLQ